MSENTFKTTCVRLYQPIIPHTNTDIYIYIYIHTHTYTCQFFYPNIKYQTLTFPNIGINFRKKTYILANDF
nr:hypothetical protein PIFADJLK_00044 [Oryctes rhinoceros nudivirus]